MTTLASLSPSTMTQLLPEPLASITVIAVGLVLGSFLNVCIRRLPLGESVVHPGSHCPGCGKAIRWYQNIPVFSWLFLRGRCAACSTRISLRYPFVEAVSGGIVFGLWWWLGPVPAFPIAAGFALAMLALFYTDWDHRLLPDKITLSGLAAGLAVAWYNPFLNGQGLERVVAALTGAALGSGLLWGFGAFYSRLRGVEAMGMGDVKMMAMVGAFTGPFGVLLTIFSASFVGAALGLAMIPLRGSSLQDTLPFGCFLAPAGLAALLVGQRVAEIYLGMWTPLP